MKHKLNFLEISEKIRTCDYPPIDHVVGLGSGGIVPASLIAYELNVPLSIVSINLRDDENKERFTIPQILGPIPVFAPDATLLLVDDVSVTGKTMNSARLLFPNQQVFTLVLKGKGDIVLFPEIRSCVSWPWKPFD